MNLYIEILTYLVGAVVSLAALLAALVILLASVKYAGTRLFISALRIFNITQLRYWLQRMEKEGLTAPLYGYREMVKARKPKTFGDYQDIEENTIRKDGTP
jgi:membrane protein implicated in regulation of membrane protease activity